MDQSKSDGEDEIGFDILEDSWKTNMTKFSCCLKIKYFRFLRYDMLL